MEKHAKVEIGHSGLKVSRLGFGGVPLGGLYKDPSEDEAGATVRRAIELGINYFDTAPIYGFGKSETRLGRELVATLATRSSSPPRLDTLSCLTTEDATRRYFIASTTCPQCVLSSTSATTAS